MQIYEKWKLMADCVVVVSLTAVEPMEEDKKEEDTEVNMEEYSSTEDLVPWKVVAPWATMHVTPGFKATGPSDKVARKGPATSSRA